MTSAAENLLLAAWIGGSVVVLAGLVGYAVDWVRAHRRSAAGRGAVDERMQPHQNPAPTRPFDYEQDEATYLDLAR